MSNLVDLIARLLISALFLISAYNKIFSIDGTMSWMEGFGIPGMLLYPTIVLEIILPLFIIVGYKAQLSAGLLAIFCIATAFIFHISTTAQNARAAKILGVDTEKVYAATFGINAALCGIAGALIAITLTLHPYVGLPYTVRSFMIVIVAGLGNLPAVALSGMGLGVFEEFADYILGTEFRIGAVFLLLVFILVYRRFKLAKKREYLK